MSTIMCLISIVTVSVFIYVSFTRCYKMICIINTFVLCRKIEDQSKCTFPTRVEDQRLKCANNIILFWDGRFLMGGLTKVIDIKNIIIILCCNNHCVYTAGMTHRNSTNHTSCTVSI